ncbi:MAG TPA: hypothetical protein VHD62_10765 [Opitutaceae bacterium]|nr:hypothetical protein [Opitutaceae bacterium]
MTAIKKTITKTLKSPAPATKTGKPAATKKVAVAVSAPAVKPVASKPVVTTITAQVDVGFGNALFLRGDGPGLSWDNGVPMTCVADDRWQAALGESARPFTIKFLINDVTWSTGADFSIAPGANVTLKPEF